MQTQRGSRLSFGFKGKQLPGKQLLQKLSSRSRGAAAAAAQSTTEEWPGDAPLLEASPADVFEDCQSEAADGWPAAAEAADKAGADSEALSPGDASTDGAASPGEAFGPESLELRFEGARGSRGGGLDLGEHPALGRSLTEQSDEVRSDPGCTAGRDRRAECMDDEVRSDPGCTSGRDTEDEGTRRASEGLDDEVRSDPGCSPGRAAAGDDPSPEGSAEEETRSEQVSELRSESTTGPFRRARSDGVRRARSVDSLGDEPARGASSSRLIKARGLVPRRSVYIPQRPVVTPPAAISSTTMVLGSISGSLSIITGGISIGAGLMTIACDHPAYEMVIACIGRILALRPHFEMTQNEEGLQKLENLARRILSLKLPWEQRARGATQISAGTTQIGAGITIIVGLAVGGPVTLVVGSVLGTVAGGVGAVQTVASSWRDFGIGSGLWKIVHELNAVEQGFRRLMQMPELGAPCVIRYSGSRCCQRYMTVRYEAPALDDEHPRQQMKLESCALRYNWYNGEIAVEAGARNLCVSFDVRGGKPVWAVDRTKPGRPWRRDENGKSFQEVFFFPDPAGASLFFSLCGTPFHSYVSEATLNGEPIAG